MPRVVGVDHGTIVNDVLPIRCTGLTWGPMLPVPPVLTCPHRPLLVLERLAAGSRSNVDRSVALVVVEDQPSNVLVPRVYPPTTKPCPRFTRIFIRAPVRRPGSYTLVHLFATRPSNPCTFTEWMRTGRPAWSGAEYRTGSAGFGSTFFSRSSSVSAGARG